MDGAFPNEPGRSFDSAGRGPRPGGGGGGRGFRGTAENAKVRLWVRTNRSQLQHRQQRSAIQK